MSFSAKSCCVGGNDADHSEEWVQLGSFTPLAAHSKHPA